MKYFNSNLKIIVNDIEFNTEKNETINWEYDVKDYNNPGKLKIDIYNVYPEIMQQIKQLDIVLFSFGYNEDYTSFFTGIIDKLELKRSGLDTVLRLTCIEQTTKIYKKLSISYEVDVSSKYIIEDIAKRSGLAIKQIDLKNEIVYYNGYNVYGLPVNEIREIVEDCSSNIKIEGDDIYIYQEEINNKESILYDYTSGLLEPIKEEFKSIVKGKEQKKLYTHSLKALANPIIKKNSIIVVKDDIINITGQVIEMNIKNYVAEYKILKR